MMFRLIAVGVGATACLLLSGASVAEELEKVTVTRSGAIEVKHEQSDYGYLVDRKTLRLRKSVSLAGVDLGTSAGLKEMEKRVTDAARAACAAITEKYPDATPSDSRCVEDAVEVAMTKVHQAASKAPAASVVAAN